MKDSSANSHSSPPHRSHHPEHRTKSAEAAESPAVNADVETIEADAEPAVSSFAELKISETILNSLNALRGFLNKLPRRSSLKFDFRLR